MKKHICKTLVSLLMSLVLSFSVLTPLTSVALDNENSFSDPDIKITSKENYNIAPGITESTIVSYDSDGTNRTQSYIVEVNLNNPTTGVISSYSDYMNNLGTAQWKMQAVRDQANAAESYYKAKNENFDIVAGVNGDFFNMGNGAPRGSFVMAGTVYNVNSEWPYFAITKDGKPVIGRSATAEQIATYKEVIGGPCVLLEDGIVTEDAKVSEYGIAQAPRTAVGIKADGSLVFLVSDGRQAPISAGQNFKELTDELIALGCMDALCLDGGGSSTFISEREGSDNLKLRNLPSDGVERTVSSAILIYSTAVADGQFSSANITSEKLSYEPDSTVTFKVNGADSSGSPVQLPSDGKLELADSSYGEIIGNVFTSNGKKGTVTVNYVSDGAVKGSTTIEIKDHEHNYSYSDGVLTCTECHGVIDSAEYNGTAIDSATGFTLQFIDGKLQTNRWISDSSDGYYVYYIDEKGLPVTGNKTINGNNYTFDTDGKLTTFAFPLPDGTLLSNSWVGSDYYLGDDGLPITGTQTIDGKTYVFGSDGKIEKGALEKIGSFYYYFIAGQALRNWQQIDGKWYYFDRQRKDANGYKMNSDKNSFTINNSDGSQPLTFTVKKGSGELIKGAWLTTDNGNVSYVWGNNERLVGWQTIDNATYYIAPETTYRVTGTHTIDGKICNFNTDGKFLGVQSTEPTTTEPITEPTTAEPIAESTTTEPIAESTTTEPIAESTTAEPIAKPTTAESTTEPTTTEPIAESTTAEPIAESTTAEPIAESTTAEPTATESTTAETPSETSTQYSEEDSSEIIKYLPGDVNLDGKITAADARLVLRISASLYIADDNIKIIADIDKSGEITAADARKILRMSANLDN